MTLLALSIQPKAANHSPFEMDWFKPCHSDYSTTYHLYTTCKETRPICHAWEHIVFITSLAYLDTHTCTHIRDLCMHFPSCAHCYICLLRTITWHIHVYVWLRHTVEQSLRSCLLSYHRLTPTTKWLAELEPWWCDYEMNATNILPPSKVPQPWLYTLACLIHRALL